MSVARSVAKPVSGPIASSVAQSAGEGVVFGPEIITNASFAGTVAGTPGTAPTSWAYVIGGGTTAIASEELTLSATTQRHFIFQFNNLALGVYDFTAQLGTVTGSPEINTMMEAVGGTAINSVAYFVDNVAANATDIATSGTQVTLRLTCTTAGTKQMRLGVGMLGNTTGTESVGFSSPSLRTRN